jgi:hypothetical protein
VLSDGVCETWPLRQYMRRTLVDSVQDNALKMLNGMTVVVSGRQEW